MVVLAAAVLGGCGGSKGSATDGDPSPPTASKSAEPVDPLHPVVEISTSGGAIRVELDAEKAPSTVENFLLYAKRGFYDETIIHYVAADKMIIGGGYGVDGQLKRSGMTVRNEAHNGLKNVRGTIAMARDTAAGVDSATSQFFINLADSPNFDHRGDGASEYGYCVFGKVVGGLEVADEISRASTRDQGGDLVQTPDPQVVVKSIRVVE